MDEPRRPELRADERTTLEQFLDQQRALVLAKLEGITTEQATARPLPRTDLTVAGIVKHLARVEDDWFTWRLTGAPMPEPWASHDGGRGDWDFSSADDDDVEAVRALYVEACERSRRSVAAVASLDDVGSIPRSEGGPVSLRWILVHMIEETAHHLGHLDLLRDALDG